MASKTPAPEPTAAPPASSGGPRLALLLLVLVLLPLLGVASIGLEQYREVRSIQSLTDTALSQTEELTRLDEFRLAVADERAWLSAIQRLNQLGVPESFVAQITGIDLAAGAEDAVARLSGLLEAETTSRYADRIAELRLIGDTDSLAALDAYQQLIDEVTDRVRDVRDELTSQVASIPEGAEILMAIRVADAAAAARYEHVQQIWRYFDAEFGMLGSSTSIVELAVHNDRTSTSLEEIRRLAGDGTGAAAALVELEADPEFIAFEEAAGLVLGGSAGGAVGADVDLIQRAVESAGIYRSGVDSINSFDRLVEVAVADLDEARRGTAEATEARFRQVLLRFLIVVGLSVAVAVALARYVGRPMVRLADAAKRLGSGASIDVERSGPAEVRRIGDALLTAERGLAMVERLEHEATHDDLTGVPTRRLVTTHLEHALARSRRSGQLGAVMFVDVDHFKDINDTYGHAVGDAVLITIAQRLRATIRLGDELGRFGGDEFVVIAEPLEGEADAAELGQRLVDAVSEPIDVSGMADVAEGAMASTTSVTVTVSIGVAVFGDGLEAADDVLHRADGATYAAKAHGRNQLVLAPVPGHVVTPTAILLDH